MPIKKCKEATPPKKHWINDCTECTTEQKINLRAQIEAEKEKDGPAKSTRAQKAKAEAEAKATGKSGASRLVTIRIWLLEIQLANVTIHDGISTMQITGRCDDGSDDSLASSKIAQQALLEGIGRLKKNQIL